MLGAPEILDDGAEPAALGMPEHQARAHGIADRIEFELDAQPAVIAFLRLFEEFQIFVKHRLFRERDAVEPGKHLVFFAAPPVGARDA